MCLSRVKGPRDEVRAVIELRDGLFYSPAQLVADRPAPVNHRRNGCHGNTGPLGNVANGCDGASTSYGETSVVTRGGPIPVKTGRMDKSPRTMHSTIVSPSMCLGLERGLYV